MRAAPIGILIAALILLPGCASKYGEQRTEANYYPACYKPIQDLRDGESNINRNTGAGALLGAFGGAVIGLLASGGKWQGAVVGGAVGGAGGAMAGNMYGRKQQERDDNIRLASYLQDIDGDISNLDITSAAAKTSLQCYDRQFQILLGEIRSRQITREAASKRYAEIQNGREEAISLLGSAAEYGRNLNMEYENAFASEERNLQTPASGASASTSVAQKSRALQAAKTRKRTLNQKTAAISEQHQAALDNTSKQTSEINAAFSALEDIRS